MTGDCRRALIGCFPWVGAKMRALALMSDECQDFDGAIVGVAEPVRCTRIEFRCLTGHHRQVVVAEDQAQVPVEYV